MQELYKFLSLTGLFAMLLVLTACADENEDDKGGDIQTSIQEDLLEAKVIYGDDDRLDIYEVKSAHLLQLAKSTVALVNARDLKPDGTGHYDLAADNFGSTFNLCPTERFREQDTAAYCSGFLVAPNIVATAGHCIRFTSDCQKTNFVFDYAVTTEGETGPRRLPESKVYSCKRLIQSFVESRGADYALVELDRAVTDRSPVKIRKSGEAKPGDELVVIGHPSGIPTKVAGGASVRSQAKGFFVANLDTYGGNSGSAVFNAKTGEVEGILVRGEVDFVFKNSCRVSNVCPDGGCRGEDVTQISALRPHLPTKITRRSHARYRIHAKVD